MAAGTFVVQVALEYPAGWTERERESERRHRERMATIQAETEARVLAQAVSYPTDYEVWRDALLIAAQTVEVKGDTDEVVYVARNLVGTLRRSGARIDDDPADDFAPDDVLFFTEPAEDADDEEDCPNCGTDDDEHEEDCPKQDQGPF